MELLAASLMRRADQCNPQEVSNALWAVGRLGETRRFAAAPCCGRRRHIERVHTLPCHHITGCC